MVDITFKNTTLRKAIALAIVKVSKQETIDAIQKRQVPKGDIYEFARAAGLLAVKKTSDVIPDCHPLPIEFSAIRYSIEGLEVHIEVEVHTIYKTGVEVEAMHGASVVALTMYDMLKPIDKGVEIGTICLKSKIGGKSDHKANVSQLKTAVIVCSDRCSKGETEDASGKYLVEKLSQFGIENTHYSVIPDEGMLIKDRFDLYTSNEFDLVIYSGGTGLAVRDITPETILPLLDIEVPGIMEAARSYGQERTGFAMLSRSVAGFKGKTLVLTMPGSLKAVREYIDALFPAVFHALDIRNGSSH